LDAEDELDSGLLEVLDVARALEAVVGTSVNCYTKGI
jgi:hypothetical protein